MNKWILAFIICGTAVACKSKKEKTDEATKDLFSIVSFLQSQAKNIDTSSYKILRIEKLNNGPADTTLISNKQFKEVAADFLELPDISLPGKKEGYEVSSTLDTMINNLVTIYTTKDPEAEITRETILWEPDSTGNAQVRTIYINRVQESGDSSTVKELTWHTNKRFQVITKVQKPDQAESVRILQVRWQ